MFYEAQQPSSEEELMPHEASVPPTPSSAKSISSKKSVRFRSGHSVIGNVHPHSSPITIPIKYPPSLAMVNISSTPMFDKTSDEEKDLGQTARPPETLPSHIPAGPSLKRTNRPQPSLEMKGKSSIVPALPTPMPGTNLPLEDPFDDAAATLHSEQPTSRIFTGQIVSDQGYISDEESNAERNDNKTACVPRTRIPSSKIAFDTSPEQENSTTSNAPPFVPSDRCESSKKSPSATQRTFRRTKALPLASNDQSGVPRLPSETQYDADAEPSDGSDGQKEPIKGVTARLHHHQGSHVADSAEDGEFGADLVRCKTPEYLRTAQQGHIPRLTVKKPSSDETEDAEFFVSAGTEAAMKYADHAEKGLIKIGICSASDDLEMRRQRERLRSINLCPTLQSVGPTFGDVENVDPASLREPTKVRY